MIHQICNINGLPCRQSINCGSKGCVKMRRPTIRPEPCITEGDRCPHPSACDKSGCIAKRGINSNDVGFDDFMVWLTANLRTSTANLRSRSGGTKVRW